MDTYGTSPKSGTLLKQLRVSVLNDPPIGMKVGEEA